MGRKSSLTEKQWAEIEKRMLDGEPTRRIAGDYGISEAAIRKRLSTRTKAIKVVANQLVEAEIAFKALPIGAQISARTLANELMEMSMHMASSGKLAAAATHRIQVLMSDKIEQIPPGPLSVEDAKTLQEVSALARLANDTAHIPLNLIKANKDSMDDLNRRELDKADAHEKAAAVMPDDDMEAAAAYQQLMKG